MPPADTLLPRSSVPQRWLTVTTLGLMLFGLALILAPARASRGFSLLVYADREHIATFGTEAEAYISLAHAVIGATICGWGVALLFLICGQSNRGTRDTGKAIALSLAAWFIPDTAFSLWSGFWQNAVLNLMVLILLALPLAATYRTSRESGT